MRVEKETLKKLFFCSEEEFEMISRRLGFEILENGHPLIAIDDKAIKVVQKDFSKLEV